MDAYRIGIRFPAQAPEDLDLARAVPVFHKWIQSQSLPGHLLIDVADYLHVEEGPGVILVSHEANIGLERKNGECGLMYLRKRPLDPARGSAFSDRLITVLGSAVMAASLLQNGLPDVRLAANPLRLSIVDKLNAPNDADTLERVLPELESVFGRVFGCPIRVDHRADSLKHFEVTVETGSSLSLDELSQRVSVTA